MAMVLLLCARRYGARPSAATMHVQSFRPNPTGGRASVQCGRDLRPGQCRPKRGRSRL